MENVPSQSAEDYLERILELIQETGQARVVDIANSLNIRQASVTNMVKKLRELGFVDHEKYNLNPPKKDIRDSLGIEKDVKLILVTRRLT